MSTHEEVHRLLNVFSSFASATSTVGPDVAEALLKQEFVFCHGDIRDIRTKHLGLRVYKVYTEARYPTASPRPLSGLAGKTKQEDKNL